jgi:hypothetical protein
MSVTIGSDAYVIDRGQPANHFIARRGTQSYNDLRTSTFQTRIGDQSPALAIRNGHILGATRFLIATVRHPQTHSLSLSKPIEAYCLPPPLELV